MRCSPTDTKCSHCGKPAKFFYENVNKCGDCTGQKAKKKMGYAVMVDEYEQQIAKEMRDIAVTKKLKKKNCINCGRVFKPEVEGGRYCGPCKRQAGDFHDDQFLYV